MTVTNSPFESRVEDTAVGPKMKHQKELIAACPGEFRLPDNRWRVAIMNYRIKRLVGVPENWRFKEAHPSKDEAQMDRTMKLIEVLRHPRSLSDDLQAIAAWMMSELLLFPPR